MRNINELFQELSQSKFRTRFKLNDRERQYLTTKGLDTVVHQAESFIKEKLAPAHPQNDGRQFPENGHPVCVALHAVGGSSRNNLARWHAIERGRSLDDLEVEYLVSVVKTWLGKQIS